MNIPIFCVFLRTFFIGSVWNYERMQNVGFVFSIIPWLKKIYGDTKTFYERVRIHYGFFNTHPYFASILIGITMKLEEQYSKNESSSDNVLRTKTLLAGPIAAIGDRLIWSTWRVFCGMLVVGYFLIHGRNFYITSNVWTGVIGFLLLYNFIGHLPIRFFGLYLGYKYSKEIIEKIAKFGLQKIAKVVRTSGIVFLLFTSVIYSLSLIDNKFLVVLFWFNVIISLFLHKKFNDEILVFLITLFFNILLFIFLKI